MRMSSSGEVYLPRPCSRGSICSTNHTTCTTRNSTRTWNKKKYWLMTVTNHQYHHYHHYQQPSPPPPQPSPPTTKRVLLTHRRSGTRQCRSGGYWARSWRNYRHYLTRSHAPRFHNLLYPWRSVSSRVSHQGKRSSISRFDRFSSAHANDRGLKWRRHSVRSFALNGNQNNFPTKLDRMSKIESKAFYYLI